MPSDSVNEYLERAAKLYDEKPAAPRKGKRLPFHIIVEMMRESDEGGRGTCEVCKVTYSMKFIMTVRLDNFRTGHVCRICQKVHQFTKI